LHRARDENAETIGPNKPQPKTASALLRGFRK
jgi:hypothetical protein